MNEIKFRAFDKENKCWHYFKLNQVWSNEDIEFNNKNIKIGMKWYQFTGLLDKKGKEVYAGDIVRIKDFEDEYKEITINNLQEFFESKGYKEIEYGEDWQKDIEIIGNKKYYA